MSKRQGWTTKRNNHIELGLPSGATDSVRVVWDATTGMDIAYVVPRGDDDNGNVHAQLISAAPELRDAVLRLLDETISREDAVRFAVAALRKSGESERLVS
jgi:hypothetical protein